MIYEAISKKTLAKVEALIESGKLWRAREVLTMGVHRSAYDPDALVALGEICRRMGDLPAAGRWFFASGVRKPEFDEALAVFRRRHRDRGAAWAALVKPLRATPIDELPNALVDELRELGLKEQNGRFVLRRKPPALFTEPSMWSNLFGWLLGIYVISSLLFGVIGIPVMIYKWLSK